MHQLEIWPETAGRLAARAILAGVTADEAESFEVRVAALEAIGALQDDLPQGRVLAAIDVRPGTVAEAHKLLSDDVAHQPSARDALATSRAAARLAQM